MYRCKNTGKNFNARIGTLFECSKIPLRKWFIAIYLITSHKKGISSIQLSKDIKVTQKTAWFLNQRIRECFINEEKLSGEVALDETFVGGKNKNRHWDKKVKNSQGRSFKDKVPVLGMLQRNGKVVCRVLKDTSYKSLTAPIIRTVKRGSTLFSDEWGGYRVVDKVYEHYIVDHSRKQYVDGNAYTNTIEGFWGIMKRGLIGIYNYTGRKHLQRYVDEFSFRYNTRNLSEAERFNLFLCNSNHRITYKKLTA
jgi:transposase-like protein